ncbi:hypothetical protein [Ralstonia pseudosolanacearum]|uniref:hypothetical protein n=1 Tax=Ralstonia pseudosolanacearum TaxID=1310165 RepID=UPI00267583AF|nr:hypothetical protein [Ralstonia pseudosolanacearum]MDO3506878.1 hypothetical protein [Ralstonia pseudosolanacearum]MDO3512912.1 hypothetical protein [Ralstonia pseudosolanacearum]MDO3536303.1 hypothetical protein [Ralstonia pseudosolanacearum]MDO3606778.1 hypothetical protein [Ralstonia pseudosolanacearum]MDO3613387.1 hypothetical protein [Ralstonia pseudosolanacearum]
MNDTEPELTRRPRETASVNLNDSGNQAVLWMKSVRKDLDKSIIATQALVQPPDSGFDGLGLTIAGTADKQQDAGALRGVRSEHSGPISQLRQEICLQQHPAWPAAMVVEKPLYPSRMVPGPVY